MVENEVSKRECRTAQVCGGLKTVRATFCCQFCINRQSDSDILYRSQHSQTPLEQWSLAIDHLKKYKSKSTWSCWFCTNDALLRINVSNRLHFDRVARGAYICKQLDAVFNAFGHEAAVAKSLHCDCLIRIQPPRIYSFLQLPQVDRLPFNGEPARPKQDMPSMLLPSLPGCTHELFECFDF